MKGYSIELDPETTAKAIGKDLRISYKNSIEVCSAVRGMPIEDAKNYLEKVIEKTVPVPYRKHKRHINHRKGLGFGPGKFPVNAAKAILDLINTAENNAEYKGLDPEEMFIAHISAYRGRIFEGWRSRARGRTTPWNTVSTNIELIIQEHKE
jgi:large subunit ribosomal protein L22